MTDDEILDYICGAGGPRYSTASLDLEVYKAVKAGHRDLTSITTLTVARLVGTRRTPSIAPARPHGPE